MLNWTDLNGVLSADIIYFIWRTWELRVLSTVIDVKGLNHSQNV